MIDDKLCVEIGKTRTQKTGGPLEAMEQIGAAPIGTMFRLVEQTVTPLDDDGLWGIKYTLKRID